DEVTSESDDGESDDNGDFEIFENYTSLDYEPFQNPPKSATEALIKFMKLVLTEIR
ncbi:18801_t:CDS:2, partial [Funneliformis geosporum]